METTVKRELTLEMGIDEAWALVSERDGQEAWLGDDVDLPAEEGASLRVVEDGVERHGLVEDVEHGRLLTFRWWPAGGAGSAPPSRVSIELVPAVAGCRVVVTERPLSAIGPQAAAWTPLVALGWERRLGCLPLVASIARR